MKVKNSKDQREYLQNQIDDYHEAIILMESCIKSTYFDDQHSLEMQNWIKLYEAHIEQLEITLMEIKI